MAALDDLERGQTLRTAALRLVELRMRDSLASPAAIDEGPPAHGESTGPLGPDEALELLALGEIVARKAVYGRQLAVRSARRAGASWTQIGAALGMTKQSAWEAHNRWIDEQALLHQGNGFEGLDGAEAPHRPIAGRRPGSPWG
jgi:hypothetical protein